jgi:hypothetical protein
MSRDVYCLQGGVAALLLPALKGRVPVAFVIR